MYKSCDFTVYSDKMIAISDIANYYLHALHDSYVAGPRKSQPSAELMWRKKRHRKTVRLEEYRAPSWSWSLVEGDVELLHQPMYADPGTVRTVCEVATVNVDPVDPSNPTGLIKAGFLKLSGVLRPVMPWNDGSIALYSPETAAVVKLIETSQEVRDHYVKKF